MTLGLLDLGFVGILQRIGTWSMTVNASDSSFSLITNAACDLGIDWGDGVNETISIASGVQTTTHTYVSSGTYVIRFTVTGGNLVPYYNNNAEAQKITALGPSQYDWSFGATLANAWYGGSNITSVDAGMDVSGVTNFALAWFSCSSLTTFPLINTSSGTSFSNAWRGCSSLTSFPLIDTSSGTNFTTAWLGCSSLTSFPLINTSSGTNFSSAWYGCSSLTATSVENILNSIDTSGRNAPASGVDITIDYNAGTGTPNITTAVTNLKGRGWTITLNGVAQ
jgi:hypothetical protein